MNKNKCYVCQERDIKEKEVFCSIECACYSGCFSVTKGWIKDVEKYKRERENVN